MTDAREKVQEAKQILDKGIDPGTHKKHIRASSKHESVDLHPNLTQYWH